jgi:hypothetical protein
LASQKMRNLAMEQVRRNAARFPVPEYLSRVLEACADRVAMWTAFVGNEVKLPGLKILRRGRDRASGMG